MYVFNLLVKYNHRIVSSIRRFDLSQYCGDLTRSHGGTETTEQQELPCRTDNTDGGTDNTDALRNY
jgi:hypothetical protein